jgi:Uma2 family endonuclease
MIAHSNYISPTEYLASEENSLIKHEYRCGDIYTMAGASNNHVLICVNISSLLRNHLRGKGCRTYIADTKVHIESLNTYYYPDVVVSCDDKDRVFSNFLRYPCLVIEVLSDSTEAFDRGDKFADYRQLKSLQEYVLISQTRKRVESFRKNPEGLWVLSSYTEGDIVSLETLGFSCTIADIYEDVDLTEIPHHE